MTTKNDGGPAFPSDEVLPDIIADHGLASQHPGMSLRDYFAAAAMAAIVSKHDPISSSAEEHEVAVFIDSVSAGAYLLADAMLEARKQ